MNPETKIKISGFISFIIKISICYRRLAMHLLEIKNLNYSVDGNTILKNINLSVNSGDF